MDDKSGQRLEGGEKRSNGETEMEQKKTMLSGQKIGTQEALQPTAGSRANDTTKQEGQ